MRLCKGLKREIMRDYELPMRFNGEQYNANRHNTLLFTHFGELAMYDHVYMIPVQGENVVLGGYIWSDHKLYLPLREFIQVHNLPQRLNSNDVAQEDIDAFRHSHPHGLQKPGDYGLPTASYQELEDLYFNESFPQDWLD